METSETSLRHDDSEYIIPVGDVVYSTTDPSGKIKTFNRTFSEASGYSPDELIGKTHALLKHKDMPPEVYVDLWETISSGETWSGIVKNRRKNGGYYWVDSSITPIIDDGFISGYASIRYAATRDQIKRAEAFYKAVREGKAKVTSSKLKAKSLEGINDRTNMNLYLASILISMAASLIAVKFEFMVLDMLFLSAAIVSFLLYKIYKTPVLEENHQISRIIKDLSAGKFRTRYNVKSHLSPYLELIRIRNGNSNAIIMDCEYTRSLNNTILENILGSIIITDAEFNIVDYNLAATSTLVARDETEIKNPSSSLLKFSGGSMKGFVSSYDRETLKKKENLTEEMEINDKRYKTLIRAIKVREEVKGWVFIFYPIDDSGNIAAKLTRRESDR